MEKDNILRLIRNIRISISNLQLYPKESALVKDTINVTYVSLIELLIESNTIILSEADKNLLFNGKKIEFSGTDKSSVNSILDIFIANNIKSITISSGIILDELTKFLEGLSKKKREKEDKISKLIKDNNITHISVNEKIYIAVGEEEKKAESETTSTEVDSKVRISETVEVTQDKQSIKESKGEKIPEKSQRELILEETQNLLEKDNLALLETSTQKLKEKLKDLDNIDRVDLAGNIVEKLASNIESSIDDVRLKAIRSFKDALPAVESLSDKEIFDGLQGKFVVAEDKEKNEIVYTELAELLEYGVNKFLKEGNYTRTIEVVGMFRRHYSTAGEGFLNRCKIAEEVLSKLANPYVIDILISDLKSEDNNRKNQAYTVIMKLQNAAVPVLIETVKETEDIHLRRVIVYAIKNMEERGMEKLVQELHHNTSPEVAKRIIEVLNDMPGSEVIVMQLKNAFKHYSPLVRREIIKVLPKIDIQESEEVLIEATVGDSDLSIRKEAISMLGKMKAKGSVDCLISLLKPRSIFSKEITPDELLEESCLALGKIGDKKAVPVLIEIAAGGSFFKKKFSKIVRLASISALSYFPLSEVKECLGRLKNTSDISLSKAADISIKTQEKILSDKGESLAQKVL